jgi:hypothetical protein
MTGVISEDALKGQQSRIMNAMRASAAPTQQEIAPQDLLQALSAGNMRSGNYLESLKAAQTGQAQGNLAAETGIYAQMKEQAALGNADAKAVQDAVDEVAGGDPQLQSSLADALHNDPQSVNAQNAKSIVMKHAAELGINPLSVQAEKAKINKLNAEATKDVRGGEDPALVKITNAYLKGDATTRDVMDRFGKVFEKNTKQDVNGNIVPLPGAPETVKTLANMKETGRQQAQVGSAFDKAQQEALGKEAPKMEIGRKQVSDVVGELRDAYNKLDTMKAAVNVNNTPSQNLSASVRQSAPGQLAGRAIGTKEQSIRNDISKQLPSLINSIRSATGMSAKAMDSNAELQFYMKMATDPKGDIQSNLRALDNIEKMFGTSAPLPSGMKGKLSDSEKVVNSLPAKYEQGNNPTGAPTRLKYNPTTGEFE